MSTVAFGGAHLTPNSPVYKYSSNKNNSKVLGGSDEGMPKETNPIERFRAFANQGRDTGVAFAISLGSAIAPSFMAFRGKRVDGTA